MKRHLLTLVTGLVLLSPLAGAPTPPTGYEPETPVTELTRLDWQFAAAQLDPDPGKLPTDYDSRKQWYQLYVPKDYDPAKPWPLVLFLSPGDDPLGWRAWEKVCEDNGILFCAAYAAGSRNSPVRRVRVVLDALDDVRRRYKIDPEQTYVVGFSEAGRLACALGFSLPEHFGGVVVLSGTDAVEQTPGRRWLEPILRHPHLLHRAQDRLSVAVVSGADDRHARGSEGYLVPVLEAAGIRTRSWSVPKLGHALPPAEVLSEVCTWLGDDLKRRREDVKARPRLAVAPGAAPTPTDQAEGCVIMAGTELTRLGRTWHALAMLQMVADRWARTAPAEKARQMLAEIEKDKMQSAEIASQREKEQRQLLVAEAKALEGAGAKRQAAAVWDQLRRNHPDSEEGKRAEREIKRLTATLTPYLGAGFAPETTRVAQVIPGSPAAKAGMKVGDVVRAIDARKMTGTDDIRRAVAEKRPGETIAVECEREEKRLTLRVELAARPPGE